MCTCIQLKGQIRHLLQKLVCLFPCVCDTVQWTLKPWDEECRKSAADLRSRRVVSSKANATSSTNAHTRARIKHTKDTI